MLSLEGSPEPERTTLVDVTMRCKACDEEVQASRSNHTGRFANSEGRCVRIRNARKNLKNPCPSIASQHIDLCMTGKDELCFWPSSVSCAS